MTNRIFNLNWAHIWPSTEINYLLAILILDRAKYPERDVCPVQRPSFGDQCKDELWTQI